MINFINTSSSILASDLDNVERRFGFRFPQEFREHYLRFNGGNPEKNRFIDEKGPCIVHDFLPIRKSEIRGLSTLEQDIQQIKVDQALLPDYLVQFAIDPGGNYYCFSTRESDSGAIYFFQMDGNRGRTAEFLSPSLSQFLGQLTTKEEIAERRPR